MQDFSVRHISCFLIHFFLNLYFNSKDKQCTHRNINIVFKEIALPSSGKRWSSVTPDLEVIIPCRHENDLIILVDSSGSITSEDSTLALEFVRAMATV